MKSRQGFGQALIVPSEPSESCSPTIKKKALLTNERTTKLYDSIIGGAASYNLELSHEIKQTPVGLLVNIRKTSKDQYELFFAFDTDFQFPSNAAEIFMSGRGRNLLDEQAMAIPKSLSFDFESPLPDPMGPIFLRFVSEFFSNIQDVANKGGLDGLRAFKFKTEKGEIPASDYEFLKYVAVHRDQIQKDLNIELSRVRNERGAASKTDREVSGIEN